MLYAHVRSAGFFHALLAAGLLCGCAASAKPPAQEAPSKPPPAEEVHSGAGGYRVIGYFTNWVENRRGCEFKVKDVDPNLFSHINFAFAQVDPGPGGKEKPNFGISPYGKEAHDLGPNGLYAQVNALKAKNPRLRTFISVGGWAHTDPPMEWLFTTMMETAASRGQFIDSSIRYARDNGFDGIDIDWEYPADPTRGGRPMDTKNFTLFTKELRAAAAAEAKRAGKAALLLTIAAPAGAQSKGFELSEIHRYLDWINLMTYDFAGSWEPLTGMNAPNASGGPGVQEAVAVYLRAGVPADKLVLGMPTYGHTFAGVETDKPKAPHKGRGPASRCTGEPGSIAYFEVTELLKAGKLTRYWDAETATPYAYDAKNKVWVTYDDVDSYQKKLDFLERQKLGGAMFWAIDLDDYGNGYPLISTVHQRLSKRP